MFLDFFSLWLTFVLCSSAFSSDLVTTVYHSDSLDGLEACKPHVIFTKKPYQELLSKSPSNLVCATFADEILCVPTLATKVEPSSFVYNGIFWSLHADHLVLPNDTKKRKYSRYFVKSGQDLNVDGSAKLDGFLHSRDINILSHNSKCSRVAIHRPSKWLAPEVAFILKCISIASCILAAGTTWYLAFGKRPRKQFVF